MYTGREMDEEYKKYLKNAKISKPFALSYFKILIRSWKTTQHIINMKRSSWWVRIHKIKPLLKKDEDKICEYYLRVKNMERTWRFHWYSSNRIRKVLVKNGIFKY